MENVSVLVHISEMLVNGNNVLLQPVLEMDNVIYWLVYVNVIQIILVINVNLWFVQIIVLVKVFVIKQMDSVLVI
jgi:hypothetical protein